MGHKQPQRDVGEPLMLTYKEAAFKISVSESVLYELLRDGKIHSVTVGPQTKRIPISQCEEFVDSLIAEQIGKAS
ncbi:MAG TPA: hypothetical protein VFQ68_45700 [Streptosporangiaceae bacterium]|nr:hypothetical protein [Streptosporangiaceae bacterium]